MPKYKVKVKWGKELFQDVEVNTEEEPMLFKVRLLLFLYWRKCCISGSGRIGICSAEVFVKLNYSFSKKFKFSVQIIEIYDADEKDETMNTGTSLNKSCVKLGLDLDRDRHKMEIRIRIGMNTDLQHWSELETVRGIRVTIWCLFEIPYVLSYEL